MTAKRVLISIDERLLSRIDRAVARRGMTRSGYLAQLASADLESESGPGRKATSLSAMGRIGDLFEE
jgi:metal-responsive CopG/Arc/MetJ family transcriptional regulator